MKVLSLDQPYPTLIVLGVKTIETRSWKAPASLIGQRIAIAATAREKFPHSRQLGDWWLYRSDARGRANRHPARMYSDSGDARQPVMLPLGVIVATALLADCAQMGEFDDDVRPLLEIETDAGGTALTYWARNRPGWPYEEGARLSAQLPYGDFQPGRWAWMLADVEPVATPVKFKGGQGLSRSWSGPTTKEGDE